jgi:hypothetical protein
VDTTGSSLVLLHSFVCAVNLLPHTVHITTDLGSLTRLIHVRFYVAATRYHSYVWLRGERTPTERRDETDQGPKLTKAVVETHRLPCPRLESKEGLSTGRSLLPPDHYSTESPPLAPMSSPHTLPIDG